MGKGFEIISIIKGQAEFTTTFFCKLLMILTVSSVCLGNTQKSLCKSFFLNNNLTVPELLGKGSMGRVYKIFNIVTLEFETHKIYVSNKGWREYFKLTTFQVDQREGQILEKLRLIMIGLKLKIGVPQLLKVLPKNEVELIDHSNKKAATLVSEYVEARPYMEFIEDPQVSSKDKECVNKLLVREMKELANYLGAEIMIHDDPTYPFTLDQNDFKLNDTRVSLSLEPEGLIITKDLKVYIVDPI